jgi:hypothetical protein
MRNPSRSISKRSGFYGGAPEKDKNPKRQPDPRHLSAQLRRDSPRTVDVQELTALVTHGYWITWSARSRSDCGIVSPSAFAVLRLITSSKLVGCSTGRSAGFAPLRILST